MDINDTDGYIGAIRAAGADILACDSFGSYQGEWWAKIRVGGVEMWAGGEFGSCSGCDAFEGEFGSAGPQCRAHMYDNAGMPVTGCSACAESAERYPAALAKFGQGYIDDAVSQAVAEAAAERNLAWDGDAADVLAFLRANRIA